MPKLRKRKERQRIKKTANSIPQKSTKYQDQERKFSIICVYLSVNGVYVYMQENTIPVQMDMYAMRCDV